MQSCLPENIKSFFKEMIRARLTFEFASGDDGSQVRKTLEDSLKWIKETGFPHLESRSEAEDLLSSKTDPELKELFGGQPSRFCLNLSLFQDVRPLKKDLLSRDAMARIYAWAKTVPRKETDPQVTPYFYKNIIVIFVSPVVTEPPTKETCPLYYYNVPTIVMDAQTGFLMGYPPLDGDSKSTRECNACLMSVLKHCLALTTDPCATYVSPMGSKAGPKSLDEKERGDEKKVDDAKEEDEDATVTYTRVGPPNDVQVNQAHKELFSE